MRTFNALFTGVGGTGVLTTAGILAAAALADGHNVRMSEIHGMAQRGGAVTCAVRIGRSVYGPIIPTGMADLLASVEPVEALRHVDMMNPRGTILVGKYRIIPTAVLLGHARYPSDEEVVGNLSKFARVVTIDAARLARDAGSILTVNNVLLGAAVGLGLVPVQESTIRAAIKDIVPSPYQQANLAAFENGKTGVANRSA
jgi:indolepyruvate ferredoxin oxidoreductase beta subunit